MKKQTSVDETYLRTITGSSIPEPPGMEPDTFGFYDPNSPKWPESKLEKPIEAQREYDWYYLVRRTDWPDFSRIHHFHTLNKQI